MLEYFNFAVFSGYGKQQQQPVITNGTFVSDSSFASVFGATETKGRCLSIAYYS